MSRKEDVNGADFIANCIVWDAHGGLFPDMRTDLTALEVWRERGASFVSVNVGFDVLPAAQTLEILKRYREWILKDEQNLVLVDDVNDVVDAKKQGKLAVAFDIEGANALSDDVEMVGAFYELGVRQMLLAYNLNNRAAGGCHDKDDGLTRFGRAVIRKMNDVGMMVDCSHLGFRASMEAIETSSAPIVFSHSNPSSVWRHARNIVDEQIKACAGVEGVIGINGMGIFLGPNDISISRILDHFCFVAELVGPEHVGIGFDYAPGHGDVGELLRANAKYWPPGNQYDTPNILLAGPENYPRLVEGLVRRGFTSDEVAGIVGGNFLRLATKIWK